MAISVVETIFNSNVGSSTYANFSSPATIGNRIIVSVKWDASGSHPLNIFDSQGNIYNADVTISGKCSIYSTVVTANSTIDITVEYADLSSGPLVFTAVEVSGITTLDKTATASSSSAAATATTPSTTVANEYVASVSINDGASSTSTTLPSGWTNRYSQSSYRACDKIVSSIGTQSVTQDNSDSDSWWICIATYQGTGGSSIINQSAILLCL